MKQNGVSNKLYNADEITMLDIFYFGTLHEQIIFCNPWYLALYSLNVGIRVSR